MKKKRDGRQRYIAIIVLAVLFAGLIGGAIYCTPPVPFIGEFLATHWLKKQAKMLQAKYEEDHDLAGKCLTQSTR